MPTGVISAYDLTVGVKVNMDEAIYILSPLDLPMLTGMDADGLSVISQAPVNEIEFSWMDEELLVPRSFLGRAFTTAETSLTLTIAGDRLKFSTGDVLRVFAGGNQEVMRVTGYSATTSTDIIVTRGYDSTTAASYASGATVIGLGTALPEGSDPEAARSQDRVSNSNNTQIFGPTAVHLTATEQLVSKYGVPNEMAKQVFNRLRENGISREQAFIYGRKTNNTSTEIRTTGGLDYYITTNQDTTSTQITITAVEALQQKAFNKGGVFNLLGANPKALGDLNATTDTARVRQEAVDPIRGRQPVMTVYTEFGPLTIVRNRWIHPTHAFGWTRENVVRRVLRPVTAERLAKTGDSDKLQIVGEEGLEVKGEEHMAKFTALSYTDT